MNLIKKAMRLPVSEQQEIAEEILIGLEAGVLLHEWQRQILDESENDPTDEGVDWREVIDSV